MVAARALAGSPLDVPGLRLTAAELLALGGAERRSARHRPATRRAGMVAARPAGSGMDLREIGAYAEGEDARRLDPAATARTGAPHVRRFHEDRDDTTVLVADFRPAMLWGTGRSFRSVRGARLLARVGWEAVARGGGVGAVAVSAAGVAALGVRASEQRMIAISEMLAGEHDAALAGPRHEPPLVEVLERAARLAPTGTRIHLATGPEGIAAGDEGGLARLARRRRVHVHVLLDRLEVAPPPRALPISDGRHARRARLATLRREALFARLSGLGAVPELHDPDDAG